MTIGLRRYYTGSPARKLDGCAYGCCHKVNVRRYKPLSHRLARRGARTAIQQALDEEQAAQDADFQEWKDFWAAEEPDVFDAGRQNYHDPNDDPFGWDEWTWDY